jgi:histidyl-tRNA synthetase
LQRSQAICTGFLDLLGLKYELNLAVKRGLSYYLEGNGFEVRCPVLGAQQQVVGGGAYCEGAGFGIGLERLVLAFGMARSL